MIRLISVLASRFSPGDLCVVHPKNPAEMYAAGRTVVLLDWYWVDQPKFRPGVYWRVAGLDPDVKGVHMSILRRIGGEPTMMAREVADVGG